MPKQKDLVESKVGWHFPFLTVQIDSFPVCIIKLSERQVLQNKHKTAHNGAEAKYFHVSCLSVRTQQHYKFAADLL